MVERKVTDLTDNELIKELIFCNKMKKFWNIRTDEVIKEIERRDNNGRDNIN